MKPGVGNPEYLVSATKAGDIAAVEAALAAGCDINACDQHGSTALARAVGNPELIALLLSRGADPTIANEWQETPLDYACTIGDKQTVILLVEHGAQINHRDYQQRSPLGEALCRGHLDIAEYLLRHGAIWSVAECVQATAQYVKAGLREPDCDRSAKSSATLGRDHRCSTRDYATFVYKLRDVSRDIDVALDLAIKESLSVTATSTRLLGGVEGIAGFEFEVVKDGASLTVLISNKKGSAQFLLKRHVMKHEIELTVSTGWDRDDTERASEVIKDNFDALTEIWEHWRFWRTIETTFQGTAPGSAP